MHVFYLYALQVKSEIAKRNFKPNCVLVILQFFLQHGLISPDNGNDVDIDLIRERFCCFSLFPGICL